MYCAEELPSLNGGDWYQRRTLTGTGVTKKTALGCTAKNLRRAAMIAALANIVAGFFCISQMTKLEKKFFDSAK